MGNLALNKSLKKCYDSSKKCNSSKNIIIIEKNEYVDLE